MNKKTLGIVLIVVAVLVIAVDVLAAPLHLPYVYDGFGWKKIIVLVLGLAVLGAGIVLRFPKTNSK